jgi:putative spermidine/putrescine transport system substrate-binding protein
MTKKTETFRLGGIGRRGFIAGSAAAAGVAALGFPAITGRAAAPLKVGVYGGYFKDSFDEHIFPDFTKATGIAIESVAEPTGEAWLVQLEQSAKAGVAPADVSMISQVAMLKGQSTKLWAGLDMSKIPNSKYLLPQYVHKYPDGTVDGIGAVAWYITLVTNTDVYPKAPESWGDMWKPEHKDRLGLLALVSNSFLLEITATTFFGGTKVLDTEEGIIKVLNKIAELKPNVKLWYRDEGQFQQALQAGEIPMGQYYHDVAGLAAADGFPVRTTFPKEGGLNDSGCWALSSVSKEAENAHTFINYMCQPAIQATMSRKIGTAPTVDRKHTDLTDDEFNSVSSEIPPIIPRYDLYQSKGDWLDQKWTEMVVGG